MKTVTRLAPAKINLTLEVLGERSDGFHEIRSVMTTVDLFDQLTIDDGRGVIVEAGEDYDPLGLPTSPGEVNSVETALGLLAQRYGLPNHDGRSTPEQALKDALASVGIRLHKSIPAAAGLGGGSSDAVAALKALSEFWSLNLAEAELLALAAQIGSDCPFFVRGGTQLIEGRGERLTPLASPRVLWLCVLRPSIVRARKTALLYSLLGNTSFGDGSRSAALAARLAEGSSLEIAPEDLCNIFDEVADAAYGSLARYRAALKEQGALAVHLCGSGPSLYGLFADKTAARSAQEALRAEQFEVWTVQAPAP